MTLHEYKDIFWGDFFKSHNEKSYLQEMRLKLVEGIDCIVDIIYCN